MNRKTFGELNKLYDVVDNILKKEDLTEERRREFEELRGEVGGSMASTWLPFGWWRRFIMFIVFLAGIYGLVIGNNYFLLMWFFLPLFSPRWMAEFYYFKGVIARRENSKRN
jgi:hypothetical protein